MKTLLLLIHLILVGEEPCVPTCPVRRVEIREESRGLELFRLTLALDFSGPQAEVSFEIVRSLYRFQSSFFLEATERDDLTRFFCRHSLSSTRNPNSRVFDACCERILAIRSTCDVAEHVFRFQNSYVVRQVDQKDDLETDEDRLNRMFDVLLGRVLILNRDLDRAYHDGTFVPEEAVLRPDAAPPAELIELLRPKKE